MLCGVAGAVSIRRWASSRRGIGVSHNPAYFGIHKQDLFVTHPALQPAVREAIGRRATRWPRPA